MKFSFKKYPDFTDKELDLIKTFTESEVFKVVSKMAEIKTYNSLIGCSKIPVWLGKEKSYADLIRLQDRIETIKSFVNEFKDMAKELLKREKKKK